MADVGDIIAELPADGSPISFDEWKNRIQAAGNYSLIPLTMTDAKRQRLVTYERVRDEAGNLGLQVRRNVGGGA